MTHFSTLGLCSTLGVTLGLTGCVDPVIGETPRDGSVACDDGACDDASAGGGSAAPDGSGDAPSGTCTLNGKTYQVGDTIASGRADCDLSCRCTSSGLECPDIGCPGPDVADAGPATSCTVGDTVFAPGTSWPCSDGCNTCTCISDRLWNSTTIGCVRPLPTVSACADAPTEAASGVTAHYLAGDVLALAADTWSCDVGVAFGLCWEAFEESFPVQARLRVTAVDGSCAVERRSQVFDLRTLREAYASAYGSEHGEITLVLRDESVRYAF